MFFFGPGKVFAPEGLQSQRPASCLQSGLDGPTPAYLLLAMRRHVPDRVSPALAKSGDWKRHRTWYQWVRGSVGAVESHTVILTQGEKTRTQTQQDLSLETTAIGVSQNLQPYPPAVPVSKRKCISCHELPVPRWLPTTCAFTWAELRRLLPISFRQIPLVPSSLKSHALALADFRTACTSVLGLLLMAEPRQQAKNLKQVQLALAHLTGLIWLINPIKAFKLLLPN